MTIAEFHAVIEGFIKSRGGKTDSDTPSNEDFLEALAEEMANETMN